MSINNHVKRTEEIGEELMKKLVEHNPEILKAYYPESSKEQYLAYDGVLSTIKGGDFLVEVKVRDKYTFSSIERYGGASLEAVKLNGMLKHFNEEKYSGMYYINFFKDKIVVFYLPTSKNQYKWFSKELRSNNYSYRTKMKEIANLPYKDYGIAVFDRQTFKKIK